MPLYLTLLTVSNKRFRVKCVNLQELHQDTHHVFSNCLPINDSTTAMYIEKVQLNEIYKYQGIESNGNFQRSQYLILDEYLEILINGELRITFEEEPSISGSRFILQTQNQLVFGVVVPQTGHFALKCVVDSTIFCAQDKMQIITEFLRHLYCLELGCKPTYALAILSIEPPLFKLINWSFFAGFFSSAKLNMDETLIGGSSSSCNGSLGFLGSSSSGSGTSFNDSIFSNISFTDTEVKSFYFENLGVFNNELYGANSSGEPTDYELDYGHVLEEGIFEMDDCCHRGF